MSVLATIEDIKIPYPTEGIIRTAQIDDTVTPENSVELAVNMNFDRVGAIQTRPGVTQYADDLVAAINNFGTLRNSIIPPGFDFIFQLGSTSQFSDDVVTAPSAVKISDTKIAIFWTGPDGHGYARNFTLDEVTGTVTPLGTPLAFYADTTADTKAILVSSSIIMVVWRGAADEAFARAFTVSGDNIVAGAAAHSIDSVGFEFSLAQVNPTHYICYYRITGGSGEAVILEIDTGTLAITEPGSTLAFGSSVRGNSCVGVGSGNRFINFWTDGGVWSGQTFLVNTGTWAITAIGSALTISGGAAQHSALAVGDGSHFVDIYLKGVAVTAQTIALNLSTFALTAVGTPYSGDSSFGVVTGASFGDGQHFVVFYDTFANRGKVQMLKMDTGTFTITGIANTLSGYDFGAAGTATSLLIISSTQVMVVWGGGNTGTGEAAVFQPYGNVVNGRWLYAASGTSVFNTPVPAGTWTSRRSGLSNPSKPRFAQYLNYIWMVNGNEQIGGDPVATSNGGNFGTDLVPANFPPGDFIHAGFEGRVWVANKTLGIIYYTDIVQFTPPTTYVLTYNPAVNFISQLAPQTGQSFTALYRVPRALLVFTEDSIFRIYGATSVDAYPAYNVGTFSQESIIETKTGIFFHHSSGFYQFDYGSQPVEISRRIIDFVRAIPRTSYGNITGVYDGFDNVEWAVGQVVVDGVIFANCVLRYTISTQVWTVYDYTGIVITAMIFYDDGTTINHLMGTSSVAGATVGKTGAMDTGTTDFTRPFYYEFIDRWRGFTEMYYKIKQISGMNVYSENAAGANLLYQIQKSGPNAWEVFGAVTEKNNSLLPNTDSQDFDVIRFRLVGNTKGTQVVVHGLEVTQLTIKGQDQN